MERWNGVGGWVGGGAEAGEGVKRCVGGTVRVCGIGFNAAARKYAEHAVRKVRKLGVRVA